jgi:RimJ/RimL family protein N-acetyltransferase
MLSNTLFQGELVRLGAIDPDTLPAAFSRWHRDTEVSRLMSTHTARVHSPKISREFIEKEIYSSPPSMHWFAIYTLDGDRLIGDIDLSAVYNGHGEAYVGIAIGEREYWDRGYGTDAMRLILRFAFLELNLQRVALNTFEYNPRAVRSYEKAGFRHEGRERGFLNREGRRWDLIYMGILRSEWAALFNTERD